MKKLKVVVKVKQNNVSVFQQQQHNSDIKLFKKNTNKNIEWFIRKNKQKQRSFLYLRKYKTKTNIHSIYFS